MALKKVPFVPSHESPLGILDGFQEGRSHMAFVSRLCIDSAKSVEEAIHQCITQRIHQMVGIVDYSGLSNKSEDNKDGTRPTGAGTRKRQLRRDALPDGPVGQDAALRGNPIPESNQGGIAAKAGSLSLMTSSVDSSSASGRGQSRRTLRREGRGGGLGLLSKGQIYFPDAILAEARLTGLILSPFALVPIRS